MIGLSNEAKMAVKDDEEIAGTLTIGAQESQCTYRLPSILKRFKAQFPQIKLIFKPAHSNKDAKEQLMEEKSILHLFWMNVKQKMLYMWSRL